MSVESESFKQYCATCHGSGGRGDGPVASALLTRPTDLTRFAFRAGQDGLTAEEVQTGILAILRYLQAIQERPAE
jgi:mono/diheme cytochrome c family protein